jgi:hypothetical protein
VLFSRIALVVEGDRVMEQAARRPYAIAGVAIVGATLIAVTPAVAPKLSNIHDQSPAVELASTADAFLDLANALDPSASTDGLIGVANNLDSFLDLFGTPTVNVVDTLASDFITDLGVGNEVGTIDGDLNAGFALLGSDLGAFETAVTTGLNALGTDLGGLGNIGTELTSLGTDLTNLLGSGGELGQIDSDIVGLDSDLGHGVTALLSALSTDLSPLGTIVTELGNTGIIASDIVTLDSDLTTLLLTLIGS